MLLFCRGLELWWAPMTAQISEAQHGALWGLTCVWNQPLMVIRHTAVSGFISDWIFEDQQLPLCAVATISVATAHLWYTVWLAIRLFMLAAVTYSGEETITKTVKEMGLLHVFVWKLWSALAKNHICIIKLIQVFFFLHAYIFRHNLTWLIFRWIWLLSVFKTFVIG